ncbi:hypothetical protein [Patulibacter americanus]|uniref:hypothetical protein n=1 Tax=Patulibacter americanus TaxID=588672 RepID=UPI0003B6A547|nr:hypothetical protein [Patulibacter americanus]
MKYLTLFADFYEVSIVELGEGPVDMGELGLPDDLQRDILRWQDEYEPLLPRSLKAPSGTNLERILALDDAGLHLADRIADAVGDGSKVQYYSSGTNRDHLPWRTGSGGRD